MARHSAGWRSLSSATLLIDGDQRWCHHRIQGKVLKSRHNPYVVCHTLRGVLNLLSGAQAVAVLALDFAVFAWEYISAMQAGTIPPAAPR